MHTLEMYDSSVINKNTYWLSSYAKKKIYQRARHKAQSEAKTSSSHGLSPPPTLLSASSKTKRRWAGTGKAHYNDWHTPLLKEVMNATVNKRSAYTTNGKLWEKRNIKWSIFYTCNIPKWENLELYNKGKQKGLDRLQK